MQQRVNDTMVDFFELVSKTMLQAVDIPMRHQGYGLKPTNQWDAADEICFAMDTINSVRDLYSRIYAGIELEKKALNPISDHRIVQLR